MKISKEEIFGPVLSVAKFSSVDEVIQRANNTHYGLGAGIISKDMDNVIKISNGIRAGTVFVNCYYAFDPAAPFGGFKDSGIGRECGEAGLKSYLEGKTVIIKRPDDSLP